YPLIRCVSKYNGFKCLRQPFLLATISRLAQPHGPPKSWLLHPRSSPEVWLMIDYVCDSCHKRKKDGQSWIVGLAAESIGAQTARREVNILSAWSEAQAVHPMAVHFCSERCKERYVTRLFSYENAS